jgi:hypothetical protein
MNRLGFLSQLGRGVAAAAAVPIARAVAPAAPAIETSAMGTAVGTLIEGDAIPLAEGSIGFAKVYADGATSLIRSGMPSITDGSVQHFVWNGSRWLGGAVSHVAALR